MENVFQDIMDLLLDIRKGINRMEDKLESSLRVKDCLNGDSLMDNADLCRLLGVTKRTLQRYRQLHLIKYYSVEGKTLYKSSEVAEFINTFEKGIARKNVLRFIKRVKNSDVFILLFWGLRGDDIFPSQFQSILTTCSSFI